MVDNLGSAIAGVPRAALICRCTSRGRPPPTSPYQKQSAKQSKELQDGSILFIIILLLIIFRSLLAPLVTLLPAALVLAWRAPSSAHSAAPGS